MSDHTYVAQWEGGARRLPPEIAGDDDLVRKALTVLDPRMAHARITRKDPDENGVVVILIEKMAGTKGAGKKEGGVAALLSLPEKRNSMIALWLNLQETNVNSLPIADQMGLEKRIRKAVERGQEEMKAIHAMLARLLEAQPVEPDNVLVAGF